MAINWTAFSWKTYNFPLSLCYAAVVLTCVIQISKILYFKHKLLGFQAFFLLLCLVWASMRAVFWAMLNVWGLSPFVVLFWLPYWLQFATFSFLALFYYATMYYNEITREHSARVTQVGLLVFAGVNAGLLAVLGVLIGLYLAASSAAGVRLLIRLVRLLLALMWCLLIGLLAVYGWRVAQLLRAGRLRVPFHPRGLSGRAVNALTCALVLVFASRAIFDLLTSVVSTVHLDITATTAWQQAVLFLMYTAWELIPAVLVLAMFWRIPRTQLRARSESTRVAALAAGGGSSPTSPLLDPARSGGSAPTFGSVAAGRYDSDDEADEPPQQHVQQTDPQALPGPPPTWYGSIERLRGQWRAFNFTGTHSPSNYTASHPFLAPVPAAPPTAAPLPDSADNTG